MRRMPRSHRAQVKCTNILKENTTMRAKLDASAAEVKALSAASESKGDSEKLLSAKVWRIPADRTPRTHRPEAMGPSSRLVMIT